jgi:hypothetical protein
MKTALGLLSVILIFSVPALWVKRHSRILYFRGRIGCFTKISRKQARALCLSAIILCNMAVFLPCICAIGAFAVQSFKFFDSRPRPIRYQKGVIDFPEGVLLFRDMKACYNQCIAGQIGDDLERCGPSILLPQGTNLTLYMEISDGVHICHKGRTDDGHAGWL